jgi:small GTP-binding protein
MMTTNALPNPDDLVLKVILVGDSGVGKSCLLKSFMGDPFKGVYTSTIGVDFEIKQVGIDGKTVNLQIWSVARAARRLNVAACA